MHELSRKIDELQTKRLHLGLANPVQVKGTIMDMGELHQRIDGLQNKLYDFDAKLTEVNVKIDNLQRSADKAREILATGIAELTGIIEEMKKELKS